jgi:hypothetical protein
VYTDGTIRYGFFTSSGEPQNINESLGDKNWKNAMDLEYSALMKSKTWHLVPPRRGTNIIDCKWVYKQMEVWIDIRIVLLLKVSSKGMA